jgi:hypothetical protein
LKKSQAFAKEDPFTIHGIFQEVTIRQFLQVLPKPLMHHKTGEGKMNT